METKNKEVRFVLEQVIGDYLAVLHEAIVEEDKTITPEEYNMFVDGLYEIGKMFDINIHEYDKGMIYPLLPSPKASIPDVVDVVTDRSLDPPTRIKLSGKMVEINISKSEARRVDKPPYVCTKCGNMLIIYQKYNSVHTYDVSPETGELDGPDLVSETTQDILKCSTCGEIFNYHHDEVGNILSFNDDIF